MITKHKVEGYFKVCCLDLLKAAAHQTSSFSATAEVCRCDRDLTSEQMRDCPKIGKSIQ